MKRNILFHDSGLLPYQGLTRQALYKLYPGQIKYKSGNVKLPNRTLWTQGASWGTRPILGAITGKDVVGNVYEITEEVALALGKLTAGTVYVNKADKRYLTFVVHPQVPVVLAGQVTPYQYFKNLKEYALVNKNPHYKVFSDETLDKIKASKLQQPEKKS